MPQTTNSRGSTRVSESKIEEPKASVDEIPEWWAAWAPKESRRTAPTSLFWSINKDTYAPGDEMGDDWRPAETQPIQKDKPTHRRSETEAPEDGAGNISIFRPRGTLLRELWTKYVPGSSPDTGKNFSRVHKKETISRAASHLAGQMADEVQDQLATASNKPTVMATRILRHKDGRKMAFAFVAIRPEGPSISTQGEDGLQVPTTPRTEYSDNSSTNEETCGPLLSSEQAASTDRASEGSEEPPESEREFWHSYEEKGKLEHEPNKTGQ